MTNGHIDIHSINVTLGLESCFLSYKHYNQQFLMQKHLQNRFSHLSTKEMMGFSAPAGEVYH